MLGLRGGEGFDESGEARKHCDGESFGASGEMRELRENERFGMSREMPEHRDATAQNGTDAVARSADEVNPGAGDFIARRNDGNSGESGDAREHRTIDNSGESEDAREHCDGESFGMSGATLGRENHAHEPPALPELLCPAGSAEAMVAAAQNGADAMYLGAGDYYARRTAGDSGESGVAREHRTIDNSGESEDAREHCDGESFGMSGATLERENYAHEPPALPELLCPAGSAEAMVAAVQNGADAVYLGAGDYYARRTDGDFNESRDAREHRTIDNSGESEGAREHCDGESFGMSGATQERENHAHETPALPELLCPAGSAEAMVAAVQNGADAVYLGAGDYYVRRTAGNSDKLEDSREYRTADNSDRPGKTRGRLTAKIRETSSLPELLCPAGSAEAMVAAVQNGADAVYLGAGDFNARRTADNFEGALDSAVRYCQARGVRVYVTLNTMVRQDELARLEATIGQVCAAGANGVIVSDLGTARAIRRMAPTLPLHASTQMAAHNPQAVEFLAEQGFRRVVLAREMSFEEIARCAHRGAELEVFVHGALCVSCSGQCLMSSMIGGRSGNRGLCAQPCRQRYALDGREGSLLSTRDLSGLDGREGNSLSTSGLRRRDERKGDSLSTSNLCGLDGREGYLLSTRDLCGLDNLCALSEAGVASLKIEGRLKRPEYVAQTAAIYRAALDALGRGEDFDAENARRELAQLFNRGGFTRGYGPGLAEPELMYRARPNHLGVEIGHCRRNGEIELTAPVDERDALVLRRAKGEVPGGRNGRDGTETAGRGKRDGVRAEHSGLSDAKLHADVTSRAEAISRAEDEFPRAKLHGGATEGCADSSPEGAAPTAPFEDVPVRMPASPAGSASLSAAKRNTRAGVSLRESLTAQARDDSSPEAAAPAAPFEDVLVHMPASPAGSASLPAAKRGARTDAPLRESLTAQARDDSSPEAAAPPAPFEDVPAHMPASPAGSASLPATKRDARTGASLRDSLTAQARDDSSPESVSPAAPFEDVPVHMPASPTGSASLSAAKRGARTGASLRESLTAQARDDSSPEGAAPAVPFEDIPVRMPASPAGSASLPVAKRGDSLVRLTSEAQLRALRASYSGEMKRFPVDAKLALRVGEAARLVLSDGAREVSVEGETVQVARSRPADPERIRTQIAKLGDTPFELRDWSAEIDENAFLPVSALNELRRRAAEALLEARCNPPHRCGKLALPGLPKQPRVRPELIAQSGDPGILRRAIDAGVDFACFAPEDLRPAALNAALAALPERFDLALPMVMGEGTLNALHAWANSNVGRIRRTLLTNIGQFGQSWPGEAKDDAGHTRRTSQANISQSDLFGPVRAQADAENMRQMPQTSNSLPSPVEPEDAEANGGNIHQALPKNADRRGFVRSEGAEADVRCIRQGTQTNIGQPCPAVPEDVEAKARNIRQTSPTNADQPGFARSEGAEADARCIRQRTQTNIGQPCPAVPEDVEAKARDIRQTSPTNAGQSDFTRSKVAEANAGDIRQTSQASIGQPGLAWPGDVVADYPLNVANELAVAQLGEWGVRSYVPSIELNRAQIEALGGARELVVYGRIPLMQLRHCPLRAAEDARGLHRDCRRCDGRPPAEQIGAKALTDRLGARFPLRRIASDEGCVVQLLNSATLMLLRRRGNLPAAQAWRLLLGPDDPVEAVVRLHRLALDGGDPRNDADWTELDGMNTTTGHYFRGVE